MISVTLDTSFLISFAEPSRPNHAVAVEYFRHCVGNNIPMFLSTIAAGEFAVKQELTDLPLQNFRILPYNLPHAIEAARLFNANLRTTNQPLPPEDARRIIVNDLKLIAQAEDEDIPVILCEDASTMHRITARLRAAGDCEVETILLTEGFSPGRIENPRQAEMPLDVPSQPGRRPRALE